MADHQRNLADIYPIGMAVLRHRLLYRQFVAAMNGIYFSNDSEYLLKDNQFY